MTLLFKTLGSFAAFSAVAAPATIAHLNGWTIYATEDEVEPVEITVETTALCEELNKRGCAAERGFADNFDPEAAAVLRIGAILDTDQPRFTSVYGSAVERPPEGEVYVIWGPHLVRIVENTREITLVYFNAF